MKNVIYIDELTKFIRNSNYRYYIFEGFDSVGKTYIINHILNSDKSLKSYNSRELYDLCKDTNKLVPYDYRYIQFLTLLNMDLDYKLIIDRGIVTSIVYSKLYNQSNNLLDDDILNTIKYYIKDKKLYHIYINHSNYRSARNLYLKSISDTNKNDSYDKFSSFDDYYSKYKIFNKEYLSTLVSMSLDYCIVNSRSDD